MLDKFLNPYDPQSTEDRIYKLWESSGFFNPDNLPGDREETFTIALPPPNVTGTLHMGHAFEDTIQDALIRFQRMRGKKALWIPGTDHAAIATGTKVEKILHDEEGKSRHDIGREAFLERVKTFAQESHDTIVNQVKKMGASLDWSREAYTFDEKRNLAVRTAFKTMYDDGLIYRGDRIVNWDPKGQTVISDDEIIRKEATEPFYYIKYGPFTIATSRPETKFGDKYVTVHPNDKRYKDYKHGQKIELEWINGPITATVIKDEANVMDIGSGAMTITPWHSRVDFEIAERHGLDKEQIIDRNGKLLPIAEEFAGMHIKKARPLILEKLNKKGLIEKIDENYTHQLATAERTGEIIEPQIMRQWFVDVNKKFKLRVSKIEGLSSGQEISLRELMQHVVKSGQTEIVPDRFENVYFHWIDNLHDWCISRQIWFGHQIPAWYHEPKCVPIPGRESDVKKCKKMIVSTEEPSCEYCNAKFVQDPDTLDTWFSSALWTFSTLGWPEKTKDLETYHPTTLIDPAYEILFLWVSRMIMMSGYLLGEVPFRTALIHGIVRDGKGQKFSKSLGNGIDPLDVINKYGADATRMALVVGVGPGADSNFSEDKVGAYKKFSNKLWNIARFVLENTEEANLRVPVTHEDQKHIDELKELTTELTSDMENYRLYLAAEKLYHYVWHTFADKIIEESKDALAGSDVVVRQSRQRLLLELLAYSLRLLHPFMPFVTEEIWQHLPSEIKDTDLLMISKWPTSS